MVNYKCNVILQIGIQYAMLTLLDYEVRHSRCVSQITKYKVDT